MAIEQLSARPLQADTASTSSAPCKPGSTSSTLVATATASRKSSMPMSTAVGLATDDSKWLLSSAPAPTAPTQQHTTAFWFQLLVGMIIKLMGIHSLLYLVLQDQTLYFSAVTFIHLVCSGYHSLLSACGVRTVVAAAIFRSLVCSVLNDQVFFYGAGVLLCFIFGDYNELLRTSIVHYPAVIEALVPSDKPEDIGDVFKHMSALWDLYDEIHDERRFDAAVCCMIQLFDRYDIIAEMQHANLKLARALKQQKSTTESQWDTQFNEGSLSDAETRKWHTGLQGVVFRPDGGAPDPLNSNDSAEGSHDRSLAGDAADVDWFHFFLQEYLPPSTLQALTGVSRDEIIATRSERTGYNALVQHLEQLWHQVYGKHTSIEGVFNDRKARARKQSGYKPCLTGHQMAAINEGCADYNYGNHPDQVSEFLLFLQDVPEYQKLQGTTNPVVAWVANIDEPRLLSPHKYLTCSCGKNALDAVLEYRKEPGHHEKPVRECPDGWICNSFFELEYLHSVALTDEHERMKLEAKHEAIHGQTTPRRCRGVQQACNVHAVPTNNIWILLDDSVKDLNRYLEPAGDNTLPAPGMYHLESYPAGFRLSQRFLEIEYQDLSPRCVHGHLHPPAMEYCMECFPSGRHFNCTECETHPLLEKPAGRDFTLLEYRQIESFKLMIDEKLMGEVHTARRAADFSAQWEADNAYQPMRYSW